MSSDAIVSDTGAGRDPATAQTPGALIRQARERAKLSLGELASLTKLPMATIDALERDDFTQLSEPVYARGYYRKCAKSLALDEAELIAGYQRLASPRERSTPVAKILLSTHESETRVGGKRHSGGRWMTVLLVVVIAVAALASYLMNESKEVAWLQANAPGAGWLKSKPVDALPAAATPAAENGSPLPQASAPSALPEAVPPATTEPAAAVDGETATSAAATSVETAAAQPAVAADAAVDASAGPAPAGSLELDFGQASWVRVEDANGKLLLSGLMAANTHQRLRGATPYSVLVGNAQGLTINFDGHPVDLAPYTRANSTARIRIP